MIVLAIFYINVVGQTEYWKIFKQQALCVVTFDQLGNAKFCPKQEIVDVITKSKETNGLT